MTAARPELRMFTMKNEEVCSDALSIRGFAAYQANDYHLEYLADAKHFYIVSPKDIVVAKPCDLDDHITWLQSRGCFEEAMKAAEGKEHELRTHDMLSIRQKFLADLVESGNFQKAASNCPQILGTDITLWEKWICTFARIKQLKAISHFIPVEKPKLGRNVYDMVLSEFLQDDYAGFQTIIREWPPELYDIQKIIPALLDQIDRDPSGRNILMETLGELYAYDKQFDKALHIYLKLKRGDVFGLITKYDLFDSIQDKIILLMEFDKECAAELLVTDTTRIPVHDVIAQLREHREYQYAYLDKLSRHDPDAGRQFGRLQVELTAEYHPERLMAFLRQSNNVPLREALAICEQRKMIPEQVFLLQRCGNTAKALDLIITELGDVDEAIEFAKEVSDEDLWNELIAKSLHRPDFVLGLLNNAGTFISPLDLIEKIKPGMKIEGLRGALVKILHDYNLQSELRRSCRTILSQDSTMLFNKLVRQRKGGMAVTPGPCALSNDTVVPGSGQDKLVVFACGHQFSNRSLEQKMYEQTGERFGYAEVSVYFVVNTSCMGRAIHQCVPLVWTRADRLALGGGGLTFSAVFLCCLRTDLLPPMPAAIKGGERQETKWWSPIKCGTKQKSRRACMQCRFLDSWPRGRQRMRHTKRIILGFIPLWFPCCVTL